jgi:hypothetical protein
MAAAEMSKELVTRMSVSPDLEIERAYGANVPTWRTLGSGSDRLHGLADNPVSPKPVSGLNFLFTGRRTGKFAHLDRILAIGKV